jgi:hypothetical protein
MSSRPKEIRALTGYDRLIVDAERPTAVVGNVELDELIAVPAIEDYRSVCFRHVIGHDVEALCAACGHGRCSASRRL